MTSPFVEFVRNKFSKKSKPQAAQDGLRSVSNSLINARSDSNYFARRERLSQEELKAIYKTGIGSKIIRLKAGNALKNTLSFSTKEDEEFYNSRIAFLVKDAAKSMIAFGRGVLLLHERGADLMSPLENGVGCRVSFFSGTQDIVTALSSTIDLEDHRYMKPVVYAIRGHQVHYSRVVDFTYYRPPEYELAQYQYGGISEFELIHDQLVNDGIVQRAIPAMIDRGSSLVYSIQDLKAMMRAKSDAEVVSYIGTTEDMRSLYGAILIDKEDTVTTVQQTLTNLADADQITLRRLAMVTGISVSSLVGENVKGLNSNGDNERQVDRDTIESLQSDYLLRPINELMRKLERGVVSFKDNQGDTKESRLAYEAQAIASAAQLQAIGEDHETYLEEKGILKPSSDLTLWDE